ncbi:MULTISPECIES: hypothetical protein [unclassified Leclercia]|uniref:Uncharacterized protein n=1 Tax=Leclercia barmai TaxID=2785629 RepID=A0ABS7RT31_9ENTR|nr:MULTISPECIES: hypothetical protein [unclassified Leclercia]MBZ0057465.1 hypothetical protein [Leclercia sp. EMC7]MCM5695629.1 hypothetical protein [Leclercia sp. LTM01]MCM5700037.1 hypothetical protein [Leclercia sp. LTM14]
MAIKKLESGRYEVTFGRNFLHAGIYDDLASAERRNQEMLNLLAYVEQGLPVAQDNISVSLAVEVTE